MIASNELAIGDFSESALEALSVWSASDILHRVKETSAEAELAMWRDLAEYKAVTYMDTPEIGVPYAKLADNLGYRLKTGSELNQLPPRFNSRTPYGVVKFLSYASQRLYPEGHFTRRSSGHNFPYFPPEHADVSAMVTMGELMLEGRVEPPELRQELEDHVRKGRVALGAPEVSDGR